jgi:hypothetical protein
MNGIGILLLMTMTFSFIGCKISTNHDIESKYGIILPASALIQQVSANNSSFRGELARVEWEKWEVERYGFSKWSRLADWQFFDMRDFAIEQKPGEEKYVSSRIDGAKKLYLFYDVDTEMFFGAVE